jgi:hypothetical protein
MRLLRTWGLGAGAAIALCVTATAAVGQAPPPTYPECTKKATSADVEGAKGAHKAASQFYERAEYDKAIRMWNVAYEFDCTANDLLVNIANAYEKLGDRASTVATLETYLKRTGPNPTLELKVKNLRAAMAPPVPTATASAGPSSAPTAPPAPEGARPYGYTPWLVTGGGGVFALVGAILTGVGYSNVASAENQCPNRTNCPTNLASKGNAGRAEAGAGWGLLTVGVVAAGGGLVWQMLYNKPQAAPATPGKPAQKAGLWVAPLAAPGTGGVSLGGSF